MHAVVAQNIAKCKMFRKTPHAPTTLKAQMWFCLASCKALHYTNCKYNYTTLHYIALHTHTLIRLHFATLHITALHYANYITPQLQLHYLTNTTTAALHRATSSSCGRGHHCNHGNSSRKHNSNQLLVHQ